MPFLFRCLVLLVVLVCSMPLGALAAGGSVLMWGSYPHLVLGNFFVGLLEAYALRKRYNTPINTWIVLLANFLSLLIGFVVVAGNLTQLMGLDFWGLASESGWNYTISLFVGLLLAFGVSVLVEWPILYGALYLRKQHHRLKALELSVFAQCVSFGFIVVYMLVMLLVG